MPFLIASTRLRGHDHFEPEAQLDPIEQRRMRGYLEEIDYIAFDANRQVLAKTLGHADLSQFERLAKAAAEARAHWVGAALAATGAGKAVGAEDLAHVAALRVQFEELAEAYEALRRMVERGYLPYQSKG